MKRHTIHPTKADIVHLLGIEGAHINELDIILSCPSYIFNTTNYINYD